MRQLQSLRAPSATHGRRACTASCCATGSRARHAPNTSTSGHLLLQLAPDGLSILQILPGATGHSTLRELRYAAPDVSRDGAVALHASARAASGWRRGRALARTRAAGVGDAGDADAHARLQRVRSGCAGSLSAVERACRRRRPVRCPVAAASAAGRPRLPEPEYDRAAIGGSGVASKADDLMELQRSFSRRLLILPTLASR